MQGRNPDDLSSSSRRSPSRSASAPQQNPITRIEQVALDLGRLAAEIEQTPVPDAKRAPPHWRSELLGAVDDIQNRAAADAKPA
jgi:hypothetical protein